ncbi:MAG TPA: GNAT family N-acetyltransferase [Acidimicrobiales bacterium]|nr:GNAT family N-acetyltransferase [Acidimicrobiales bacterium]
MLERWVADAASRSADYELLGWDGPVHDEHMERWLDLVLVMNTAPRDDLDLNDFTLTAEEVREHERIAAAGGYEPWTLVVRHKETGAWAGFHDVMYDPTQPQYVYVDSTGVRPEHRGHALGKWLKAAMTLRVLDERPGVTHIRTGNADSNDAMLGINREMGYRPLIAQSVWELPVETAATWLADRGVALPAPD